MIKAFLLAGILALASPVVRAESPTVPSQAAAPFVGTFTDDGVQALYLSELYAWFVACKMKQVDCSGIPRPWIAYTWISDAYGLYKDGGRFVYVHLNLLMQPFSTAIMVHEMIHYIQFMTGQKSAKNDPTNCVLEEEAFRLTFEANKAFQIAPLDARVENWEQVASRYDCEVKK